MYYIIYNPLAKGGDKECNMVLAQKIAKKYEKKGQKTKVIDVFEFEERKSEYLKKLKETDRLIIRGGDGTIHQMLQYIDFKEIPSEIYISKGGTGNDYARGHRGRVFDVTKEIKELPYFSCDDKKIQFLNGVGIGIDAVVCHEVNAKNKQESYFKTAVRAFKNFKTYHLELEIDGINHSFDDVYFFVCMHGKYIGGGMKIAPKAIRADDHLDLYVIRAKNYRQIVRLFPLVFLGLHTKLKKYVTYFNCRNVKIHTEGCSILQSDGEVHTNINDLEIHRY